MSECVAIPLEHEEDIINSSTRHLPSRFLCPSNLGALLDSTTVSLGWKETNALGNVTTNLSSETSMNRTTEESDAYVTDSGTLVRNGKQECYSSGMTDFRDSQQEYVQVDVEEDLSSREGDVLPSELHKLPQLVPPAPFVSTSPLPPRLSPLPPRLSPLFVPRATVGEFHGGKCCNCEADMHRHHQLCIAIDEDSPLNCTPSVFHNHSCGSQRSSVCSSTHNEGDIPGLIRHNIMTHSRNVSETLSLPPYHHSSSTSSAYHSRNSSLGSQLSSCFESDNMLDQLNDIDSCLALHTGSHGDLKRIQNSRYAKQGDSSPSSYSSELSLHQHMSKPLDRKEAVLKLSPVNLEDTLRNLSLEKLDECKKNMLMKSSEWIKRQLESLVQVKVSSKTKHVVHFNVKAGDVIIWEFATKKKDIAFGVFFEATEVATEQSPVPDSHEYIDSKMSSILPIFRVGTHAHPTVGTHTASLDGIYEIIFDNTYSRFFAKELYYRIRTQPSEPNANYWQQ